jgi:hypothetical protein
LPITIFTVSIIRTRHFLKTRKKKKEQKMSAAPAVRFGDWIGEGWKMFTEQWKAWVLLTLGFLAVLLGPMIVFMVVFYVVLFAAALSQSGSQSSDAAPVLLILFMYAGFFGMMLLLMPLVAFFMGGMYRAAFKQLRGGTLEFRDLFSAKDCYLRVLGATLLVSLLTAIGALFCIIPAFIVAGMFYFTIPLIVDKNMSIGEAMRASMEATKGNLFMFILFFLLVQLIASAGSYLCYVGMLASYPLMFTIHAIAFRDTFGVDGARVFSTAPAPPSSVYAPPQAPGYPPAQINCARCGNLIPSTAGFCPACGNAPR